MKKLLITILPLILFLASCSDYLDRYPSSSLVLEEYWNNKEELHDVMIGAYASLNDLDAHLWLNGEVRADMITSGNDIGDCTPGSIYNTNDISNVMSADILTTNKFAKWDRFYKIINYCNHIIKYAPIIYEKDATFTEYYRDAYIGEATALRSLMYFYLVRIYKDVPYITEPSETDMIELYPVKISGDSILNYIIDDLDESGLVESMADYYGSDIYTIGRINRFAGYALIAEIALWQYDYEKVITYTEKIENSGKYFLLPNSEWFEAYSLGNTLESIFEIQYDQSNSQSNKMYALTINSSEHYFYASNYAEELYIEDAFGNLSNEKTRAEGTLVKPNTYSSYYNIYKYTGASPATSSTYEKYRSSGSQASANFIIYRYSDVLLMKAEALTQQEAPDYATALELVNSIRTRANVTTYTIDEFSSSQLDAETIILEERARELAYEGKRWFDLIRFAKRNDFAQKETFISLITDNKTGSDALIISSKLNEYNSWFLPIYIDEISNNPNLVQNSYYDGL